MIIKLLRAPGKNGVPIDLNIQDDGGCNALMIAVDNGYYDIITTLLDAPKINPKITPVNLSLVTNRGWTAHKLASVGKLYIAPPYEELMKRLRAPSKMCGACKTEQLLSQFAKAQLKKAAAERRCLGCIEKSKSVAIINEPDLERLICSACRVGKVQKQFSKAQRSKKDARKCSECVNQLEVKEKEAKAAIVAAKLLEAEEGGGGSASATAGSQKQLQKKQKKQKKKKDGKKKEGGQVGTEAKADATRTITRTTLPTDGGGGEEEEEKEEEEEEEEEVLDEKGAELRTADDEDVLQARSDADFFSDLIASAASHDEKDGEDQSSAGAAANALRYAVSVRSSRGGGARASGRSEDEELSVKTLKKAVRAETEVEGGATQSTAAGALEEMSPGWIVQIDPMGSVLEGERLNAFSTFVEEKSKLAKLPAKDVLGEAERLEVTDKGVMVIVSILWNTADIPAAMKQYQGLLQRFTFENSKAQLCVLQAVEKLIEMDQTRLVKTPWYLKAMHDLDLIDEEVFVTWEANLSVHVSQELAAKIRTAGAAFLTWIKEVEEEDSSEEDEKVPYESRDPDPTLTVRAAATVVPTHAPAVVEPEQEPHVHNSNGLPRDEPTDETTDLTGLPDERKDGHPGGGGLDEDGDGYEHGYNSGRWTNVGPPRPAKQVETKASKPKEEARKQQRRMQAAKATEEVGRRDGRSSGYNSSAVGRRDDDSTGADGGRGGYNKGGGVSHDRRSNQRGLPPPRTYHSDGWRHRQSSSEPNLRGSLRRTTTAGRDYGGGWGRGEGGSSSTRGRERALSPREERQQERTRPKVQLASRAANAWASESGASSLNRFGGAEASQRQLEAVNAWASETGNSNGSVVGGTKSSQSPRELDLDTTKSEREPEAAVVVEKLCDMCHEDPALHHCKECKKAFCDDCLGHKKGSSKTHTITRISSSRAAAAGAGGAAGAGAGAGGAGGAGGGAAAAAGGGAGAGAGAVAVADVTAVAGGGGRCRGSSSREERIHVFVDNSNVAKPYRLQHGKDTGKRALHIFPQKLAKVVEGGRRVEERWVVGSGTRSPLQQQWKSAGYAAKWDPRYGSEHNVDEALQAQIWKALSKSYNFAIAQHTLVLLTGDGNQNGGASSFPDCIQAAMQKGWRVEVWCWRGKSSKVYERFAMEYPSSFVLSYLDEGSSSFLVGVDGKAGISGDTENTLCVVCWENPRTVVFLPCKHLQLCEICAGGCTECPYCRVFVESMLQVYT